MDKFDEIYRENAKVVMNYLLKLTQDYHLSEELTQETFYIAYRKYREFRGDCRLNVWLCQIAKNLLFDEYKAARRKNQPLELFEHLQSGESVEQGLESREQRKQIYRLVHRLKDPYKEVFLLHCTNDVPLKDIAELFGKSESWARVTYYRAKEQLRNYMKEAEGK